MQVAIFKTGNTTVQTSVCSSVSLDMGRSSKYKVYARMSLLHISPCKLICWCFVFTWYFNSSQYPCWYSFDISMFVKKSAKKHVRFIIMEILDIWCWSDELNFKVLSQVGRLEIRWLTRADMYTVTRPAYFYVLFQQLLDHFNHDSLFRYLTIRKPNCLESACAWKCMISCCLFHPNCTLFSDG